MKHITIGILAHVDAGKTTLSECMLYLSGQIRKLGRVDHKDAFLDTYELERERGITIFSKQAEVKMGNLGITLLDTPGHVDFSAEMERTLQVLDYAILVSNGADGVQGHTRTLWRLLKRYQIPTFIFINKMEYKHPSGRFAFKRTKVVKIAAPIANTTRPLALVGLVTGSVNINTAPKITPPVNKCNNGYQITAGIPWYESMPVIKATTAVNTKIVPK